MQPSVQDLAAALPRDAFVRAFPHLFLVVTDTGDDEPPSSFETVDAASAPRLSGIVQRSVEVHAVAKGKGNPYPDRISVGRAVNCDVVLRYASISKLHAYFRERAGPGGGGPHTPGGVEIVDVGSQVGTRVSGRALVPNQPVPVATGALVLIGRVATRLANAGAVWDLLKAQERLSGT